MRGKETIRLLVQFMICFCIIVPFAQTEGTAQEEVSERIEYIAPEQGRFHLVLPKNTQFGLRFTVRAKNVTDYCVTYTLDGEEERSRQIQLGACNGEVVYFDYPPKLGRYDLHITVTRGEQVVFDEKHPVVSLRKNQPTPMWEFTGWGVCTHMDRKYYSPEDVELLKYAGIQNVRESPEWQYIERIPGVYDYKTQNYDWYNRALQENKMNLLFVAGYNNSKYFDKGDGRSGQIGLYNQKQRKKYQLFVENAMETFQTYQQIELWNEPNIPNFWGSVPNESHYAKLVKYSYPKIKDKNPLVSVSGMSTAGTDTEFMKNCFELGLYPYIEAIAYHPYVWPNVADTKRRSAENIDKVNSLILEYGGWKDSVITEVGWPISMGQTSPKDQAKSIVKQLAFADAGGVDACYIYDFKDDGENPDYTEHNFGMVEFDGTPKRSFAAYANMLYMLGGGFAHGRIDLELGENSFAYLYAKDGKPVLLAWISQEESEYVFSEAVSVYDIYGNLISKGNKAVLGDSPVYITGLSEQWFARACSENVMRLAEKWMKNYAGNLPEEMRAKCQNIFKEKENMGEDSAQNALTQIFELGRDILQLAKKEKLQERETSQMLYQLYEIAEYWGNFLSVNASKNKVDWISPNYAKLVNVEEHQTYSSEIRRTAGKLAKKREKLSNVPAGAVRSGLDAAWAELEKGLFGWYREFSDFEQAENLRYSVIWPLEERVTYLDEKKDFRIQIENSDANSIEGYVEIRDSQEELIARSDKKRIAPGAETVLSASADLKMHEEEKVLFLDLMQDGICLKRERVIVQKRDIAKMHTELIEVPSEKIKYINVVVENLFDIPQTLVLEVSSDTVQFPVQTLEVSLLGKEKKIVQIPVSSVTKQRFNLYVVDLTLKNSSGSIVAHQNEPLSFAVVSETKQKIDVEKFDGNIEQWSDAYPMFINPPENADMRSAWEKEGLKAFTMMKWDGENLYILTDVYDRKHLQESKPEGIWEGDSLQIAVDRAGDRASSYQEDDYEMGVALSSSGVLNYVWAPSGEAGVNSRQKATVLRNNQVFVTRYLTALSAEKLAPVRLKEGEKIGLNWAINDANALSREAWYEFTPGLASTKDPSQWQIFVLHPMDERKVEKEKEDVWYIDLEKGQ